MPLESAGLLMFRIRQNEPEFLLVHPGGPYWKTKDQGAWSIPKGEIQPGEEALETARREFAEELGFIPEGSFIRLTPIRQKAGKLVRAWAFEGDCDAANTKSNIFQIEWPPRSGRMQTFPEVDQAAFFRLEEAEQRINQAQLPLLHELRAKLSLVRD